VQSEVEGAKIGPTSEKKNAQNTEIANFQPGVNVVDNNNRKK
jgi:hypothetical protein